jgi:hypothetical protein
MADVEENETVIAQKKEPWVTLPCSVSDAEARVMLLKKHKWVWRTSNKRIGSISNEMDGIHKIKKMKEVVHR